MNKTTSPEPFCPHLPSVLPEQKSTLVLSMTAGHRASVQGIKSPGLVAAIGRSGTVQRAHQW